MVFLFTMLFSSTGLQRLIARRADPCCEELISGYVKGDEQMNSTISKLFLHSRGRRTAQATSTMQIAHGCILSNRCDGLSLVFIKL